MQDKSKIKSETTLNLGLLGLGHMGKSILQCLRLQTRMKVEIFFFDPHVDMLSFDTKGLQRLESFESLFERCDLIFLCVKPHDFKELSTFPDNSKVFCSMMAGVNFSALEKKLHSQQLIRCMPNIGLSCSKGVLGICSSSQVAKKNVSQINKLFEQSAFCLVVKDEKQLNALTAISGSGPAYFAFFAQSMIKQAIDMGFSPMQASRLVLFTLHGTSCLLERTKLDPKLLLNQVTSKEGTTQAALEVWDKEGLDTLVAKGMQAAHLRAEELAQLLAVDKKSPSSL